MIITKRIIEAWVKAETKIAKEAWAAMDAWAAMEAWAATCPRSAWSKVAAGSGAAADAETLIATWAEAKIAAKDEIVLRAKVVAVSRSTGWEKFIIGVTKNVRSGEKVDADAWGKFAIEFAADYWVKAKRDGKI